MSGVIGSDGADTCDAFDLRDMREKLAVAEHLASVAMMTSPAAKRRLTARKLEMGLDSDLDFVPPRQVLLYLVRMGSFTSAPKIENPDQEDDDIIPSFEKSTREELLTRCREEISASGRPPLLERDFRKLDDTSSDKSPCIRVLQWNVLSQCLGCMNDNFVNSPPESLDWSNRKFLMLQEIIQHDPDVICLEEVDHFKFLEAALGSIGYCGKFFQKPDSPCVYLEGNNGPDGSALFYRSSRFELVNTKTRILEVWRVQSNQVGLACVLKERGTGAEVCVAVTHLKAKSGALLATLRDNQGRDLLDWLENVSEGRPVVLCGDFNAEPSEPVYKSTVNHRLDLRSAYRVDEKEPRYTTWKIREEGEICHTIDYIFHSSCLRVKSVLEFPDGETIGPGRLPSLSPAQKSVFGIPRSDGLNNSAWMLLLSGTSKSDELGIFLWDCFEEGLVKYKASVRTWKKRGSVTNKLKKAAKTKAFWLRVIGIALVIIAVVLGWVIIPKIVRDKIKETIAIKPNSEAYKRWEKLPVTILFKVTIFEVLNPTEVQNSGATPIVRERGPFVYREVRQKKEVKFPAEDRAVYFQETTFEFDRKLSNESAEVEVTVVNVPSLAFTQILESLPGTRKLLPSLGKVLPFMWPGNMFFAKVKVKDFLFDGMKMYCNPDLSKPSTEKNLQWLVLCSGFKYMRPTRTVEIDDGEPGINTFAAFKYKKKELDGPFEIKLGISDPEAIGEIVSWKGKSDMGTMWGGKTCNKVSGTDTTVFRPFLHDVDKLTVFNTDICRSLSLTYDGMEEYKGVPVRRYVGNKDLFAGVKERPENYCYCPRSVKQLTAYGGCLKSGLLDVSSCQGAPVFASYPHLLMADEFYQHMVKGLKPDQARHQVFVDIEPNTGYPMRGALRAQLNVFLKSIKEVESMKNLPNVVTPILWLEESVELPDDLVDEVKSRLLNLLTIADVFVYTMICVGCYVFLFGQFGSR